MGRESRDVDGRAKVRIAEMGRELGLTIVGWSCDEVV